MMPHIELTNKDNTGGYIMPAGLAIILFRMFLVNILAQRAGLEVDNNVLEFMKEMKEYEIKI